jgi:ribosomal protein L11 methyltransferase
LERVMGTTNEGPPEELHVYYLNGVLPQEAERALGQDFVGNWEEGGESFLFFRVASDALVRKVANQCSGLKVVDAYRFSYEEWQGANVDRLQAGPFEICPAWQAESHKPGKGIRILLDPGVVFGSGLHPTTQDCLRALAWIWEQEAPESLLDLGTGTGILAVAGILLGAGRATAVDLNPLCVRTARRNLELNGVESQVRLIHGPAQEALEESADVVVANIHYPVIEELLEQEAFRRRCWMVVSGLMRSQAVKIRDRMLDLGMKIVRELDRDSTWYTLVSKPSD